MYAVRLVGENRVVSIFIMVLLPAPLGPRSPNTSFFLTLKLTLLTAV